MAHPPMTAVLYTIGHSNHPAETFIELLRQHEITAICDVRSTPYSRRNPQFNRETLKTSLTEHDIAYVFLGAEFGARSLDPSCYKNGKVQYSRLAKTDAFRRGVERLRDGMTRYHVALMCAEKDPLTCHRSILVCRNLKAPALSIVHILADGQTESHEAAERRLLELAKIPEDDLFLDEQALLAKAYDIQAERMAYVRPTG